jgi:hypothetical protein
VLLEERRQVVAVDDPESLAGAAQLDRELLGEEAPQFGERIERSSPGTGVGVRGDTPIP